MSTADMIRDALGLHHAGRLAEAEAAYRQVLAAAPRHFDALHCLGVVRAQCGDVAGAATFIGEALKINPNVPLAHLQLGDALVGLGRTSEALASFDRAIALKPDYAEALVDRSNLLVSAGRWEEALADTERALTANPRYGRAASANFNIAAILCDWRGRAEKANDLARRCRAGQDMWPFVTLFAVDDPEIHFLAAKNALALPGRARSSGPAVARARLRIAYLSQDFHDHPVAYQTVELFECHDRTRFETYGFCLKPAPDSAIRRRLRRAFDHFVETGARSNSEIAALLAGFQIDIAVDLGGYTANSRTGSLAHRATPVAVQYLGYPGTLGLDYIDYIIADAQVIPPESERFYTEKVVRLPGCYLPSATKDRADPAPPSRADAGLPQSGFVFCAFNSSFKIAPEMFDIWMRLLRAVDSSVLWLNVGNAKARDSLCAEAEARGVSPQRLIFASRVDERGQYFDRLALADLFLDTLPYNAHATASDMLWVGVPVLTCMGRSFPARVAGSMLTAIGAEELIARDLGEYEATALKLARSPELLAAIRTKLARKRAGSPLFDTASSCRHLESAYETMWQMHLAP